MADLGRVGHSLSDHRRPSAPSWVAVSLLVLGVALVLGDCPGAAVAGETQRACPPAPPFTLPDLEGNNRSLADFLGEKPVLLEFMSPDCPHCSQMALVLTGLHAEYGSRVKFLTVAFDNSGKIGRIQTFVRRHQHPWPYLLGGEDLIRAYRLEGVPTFFFLTPNGGVCGKVVGSATPEVFRQGLDMVLGLR